MQKQKDNLFRPVCYFSKRTTESESKFHSYELEMLAIVNALNRFRVYLHGIKFKIVTDCNSVKMALNKKEINTRINRWALVLQNFNYELEHRDGNKMKHVDALSRSHNILVLEGNTFEQSLSLKQTQDTEIIKIRNILENREHPLYELRNGLVYRKSKDKILFYVPSCMEYQMMHMYHNEMGHMGVDKTCELILRSYWFPKIRIKVKIHIDNCLRCIEYNPNFGTREGFLNNIPKGNTPFETIHVDHYGPLQKSKYGYKHIFLIVDGFTKFVKLYPCKTTQSQESIKHLQAYFKNYSKPVRLISDRGSCFTSIKFKEFLSELNIKHVLIATGAPRANGQVERVNRTLTAVLGKLSPNIDGWYEMLDKAEFVLNNTINRSINNTPARLLFGRDQLGAVDDNLRLYLESFNENEDINVIREKAASKIVEVQESNKLYYDKHRKAPHVYAEGEYVMVSNVDTTIGANKKLIPKYRGPYVIKTVLPHDRYEVTDIIGFQNSQIPYDGILDVTRIRPYALEQK